MACEGASVWRIEDVAQVRYGEKRGVSEALVLQHAKIRPSCLGIFCHSLKSEQSERALLYSHDR